MSEPMTSGEIEDVLSSIRKLVSEDLRPAPRVPARTAQPEPDKLILTPALRVVEGSAEAEATLAADAPEPNRRLRLDSVVFSFAAQVNPPTDGWESETGDATVTRLVRSPPQVEPAAAAEAFPDVTAEDDTGEGRGITDAEIIDAVPAGGLHFAWQARRAGLGDDDAPVAQGDPEVQVRQGSDDAPEAPMADLDVDALADIVRDILREELQGALGERMTRNIRKMVRAEVARVLATKDLA
jgi:hypothetical protein